MTGLNIDGLIRVRARAMVNRVAIPIAFSLHQTVTLVLTQALIGGPSSWSTLASQQALIYLAPGAARHLTLTLILSSLHQLNSFIN